MRSYPLAGMNSAGRTTRACIAACIAFVAAAQMLAPNAAAQPAGVPGGGRDTTRTTTRDTTAPRHWYDTLTVTKPRYATMRTDEQYALAAFAALSIPAGLLLGTFTILPPSINVLMERGSSHTGVAFSSGVSLVADTNALIFFPTWRLQVEAGYYLGRKPSTLVRTGVLFDLPIASVHRRDLVWFGIAGGAGASTDFHQTTPYAEGWVGILNPMGIRYLTLFPMHSYGIRGRIGYDAAVRRPWYELAVCATSTFWL